MPPPIGFRMLPVLLPVFEVIAGEILRPGDGEAALLFLYMCSDHS